MCRLPETWARRLFTAIADALWWRRGRGVRQLEANLARVLGPDAPPDRTRPGLDPQRLARTNADSSPEVAGSV